MASHNLSFIQVCKGYACCSASILGLYATIRTYQAGCLVHFYAPFKVPKQYFTKSSSHVLAAGIIGDKKSLNIPVRLFALDYLKANQL